jgi:hypothetical protein
MFQLKEDVANVCIFSVRSWILLINLKFEKLNSVKVQLNIIVILCNSKLFHLGDFSVHVHLEVRTNPQ